MTDPYALSSRVYDAQHEAKDFPSQTARLRRLIEERHPGATSVLDVACGTGRHLALLGDSFDRMGVDLSEEMLQIARETCPGIEFVCQDMVELELARTFDVVTCLFSSVAYAGTKERLDSAVAAMARHLAPGGVLIVEPWFTPEQYWEGHLSVNHREVGNRAITWMYVQEREGSLSRMRTHYLVGGPEGVDHWVEIHEAGLFTHAQYVDAFASAGLCVDFREGGVSGRGAYIAWRDSRPAQPPQG